MKGKRLAGESCIKREHERARRRWLEKVEMYDLFPQHFT